MLDIRLELRYGASGRVYLSWVSQTGVVTAVVVYADWQRLLTECYNVIRQARVVYVRSDALDDRRQRAEHADKMRHEAVTGERKAW